MPSPSKSALAMAYSAKRANAKKGYARGGMVDDMDTDMSMEDEDPSAVDSIMKDRKKMASGGLVEDAAPAEPAFEDDLDLEPVHTVPDEEHDTSSPSEDDESLIGQILKDRRNSRRGL